MSRAAGRKMERRRANAASKVGYVPTRDELEALLTEASVLPTRLDAVRAALLAAGEPEPTHPQLVTTYEMTQGSPARRFFYERAIADGLTDVYSEGWLTDEHDLGDGAIFQDASPWGAAAVFETEKGALALVAIEAGELHLSVAATGRDNILDAVGQFRARYPFAAPATDDLVPVSFWSYGKFGPQSYTRRVDVQPWADIEDNYTADVRAELGALMDGFEPGKGGQLLLWQGPPGTGKTWALRALASEWREWAEFHYVTDPDRFFGEHADYMVEVLLRESFQDGSAEKWRLLVLEDTGELLSSDAKEKSGQALSRLLNVVDGLIGQGLRVLVLVTTNDEIETFHPAVSRPGRCAAQVAFAPLSGDEVAALLDVDEAEPATLAELYADDGFAKKRKRTNDEEAPGDDLYAAAAGTAIPLGVMQWVPYATTNVSASGVGNTTVTFAPFAAAPAETAPAPVDDAPANAAQVRWEAIFAPEGKATDDGRMFWPGAISWRELPLSLMAMIETSEGGHIGAQLAGRIDNIYRDGSLIRAEGVFDNGDYGSEIARLVADKTLTGLSVDIAAREFEFIPRSQLFDDNGELRPDALDRDTDEEADLLDLLFGGEDLMFVVTDGVIGAATVCPFPAFEDASIALSASGSLWTMRLQGHFTVIGEPQAVSGAQEDAQEGLTAAAAGLAPLKPPVEWFDDPEFEELTAVTVTDEGRIFGHAASWDRCHIGLPGQCVTAPRSNADYAYYLLGEVETEAGEHVAVGKITLGTGHAAKHLGRQATADHYDNTGTVVADVNCGEDEHGIWVSGALRPDLSAERVRELKAAVLSGDWRAVDGNLELVGLLAVNVPGFPIPRPRALAAAGDEGIEMLALVAAGIHDGRTKADLSDEEIERLRSLGVRAVFGDLPEAA